MEAHVEAMDIYRDIDAEQSSQAFADQLRREAEHQQEIANQLTDASDHIRSSLGAVTMSELPDGVAGQANLDSDEVWIDPSAIQSDDGNTLINIEKSKDIAAHEWEHTEQSAIADQDGIEVDGQKFDEREIREAAAISVQKHTDFLSAEYQRIAADLPMNQAQRNLVREGKFSELEEQLAA
tara:strand:+ start:1290 stop:1832 length:543 start_codon:yes stop_codon:yes gene_type:complete